MAFLGAVRSCVQAGDLAGSLRDGQKEQRRAGYRRVTFAVIEQSGIGRVSIADTERLVEFRYLPLAVRKKEYRKAGKVPRASIPAIRDRVVQGSVEAHSEPIFEADFQPGSYGYRPQRTAQERVACG